MLQSTSVPHEASIRLLAFVSILALLLLWERSGAVRGVHTSRARWFANFGLGVLSALLVRVIFPAGAVGAALFAQQRGWGLFRHWGLPPAMNLALCVLLLDLTIYFQHRAFHTIPWLWRVHRVHHADPEVDVSTALRFHPVEILLSLLLKIAVVVSLGLAPAGVLIFEIVLNGAAMFNHAKASLSHTLDRIVRLVLVTPSMHRVHHSTFSSDAACNFGFSVSWWDRLFATYRQRSLLPQPSIGLPDAPPTPHHVRLPSMLAMPFVSRK